jgi:hypothetical protein
VASGSWDQTVKLWDISQRQDAALITHISGYTLAFTTDGKTLACGTSSSVEVWDVAQARLLFRLPLPGVADISVAFSPDGRTLAAAGTDGGIYVCDVSTHTIRRKLSGHKEKVWCLAFAPRGELLATGSQDTTVKLWDLTEGRERATLVGNTSTVRSIVFSKDGQTLISGTHAEIKFWNLAHGNVTETLLVSAPQLAISPNGEVLASSDKSHGIRFRDLKTKKDISMVKEAHKAEIYSVAFSADGKTLATASWDGTAKFWRVPGGQLLLTIHSEFGVAWSGVFSADRRWFATGSGSFFGGEVRLLRAATEAEISLQVRSVPTLTPTGERKFPVPQRILEQTIERRARGVATNLLDLTRYFNASLTDGWIPTSSFGTTGARSLGELTRGVHEFAGVSFDVRGLIQLAGRSLNFLGASYEAEVKGVPLNRRCRKLHFLHGTGWRMPDGSAIGEYVVHYADGEQKQVPIIYGDTVRDWWFDSALEEPTAHAVVAWTGKNAAARSQNMSLRLYKYTWENPRSEVVIETIDLISANSRSSPFVLSVTVEP